MADFIFPDNNTVLLTSLGISTVMIGGGILLLRSLKENSPLAPHALQLSGLTFIAPILLVMSLVTDLPNEALVGFIGTIVGYFFGVSKVPPDKK
ncbi:hypothetical protein [Labrenzia sp. PHM005]|uniref:hypothetical protein n=1 Tax=Labrenzia sp. PHM005 TaxID=2590016 RepID=UPI00114037DE|nr:hypothetical protein [Labrenzia sp. PHM005]QDG74388.1 hypothetical protein FJ695_00035 [Labrenzia sp. PHM005]